MMSRLCGQRRPGTTMPSPEGSVADHMRWREIEFSEPLAVESGGRCGEEGAMSSHAPRAPALAPAEPDARLAVDAGQASGFASDWPGCGGIGGATAPHGPPHRNDTASPAVVRVFKVFSSAWSAPLPSGFGSRVKSGNRQRNSV